MAPAPWRRDTPKRHDWDGSWKHDLPIDGYVLESWSQGFLVGALVAMAAVTIANMSKPLLHKLILVEVGHPVVKNQEGSVNIDRCTHIADPRNVPRYILLHEL